MADLLLLETYKQCRKDLLGFLTRRLHCRFIAADLTQDLYIQLTRLKDSPEIQNQRAYLFRMAANLAIDYQRVEGRRQELLKEAMLDEEHELTLDASPERTIIADEQLQQIQDRIARLPELSRKIFYATRFEGKTQRQIAEDFNVSTTTVENHIKRVFDALREMRDRLEK